MSRILITGNAGFIGDHLTAFLYSRGHHLAGLDWHKPDNDSFLNSFYNIDLTNPSAVLLAIQDYSPEAVIHLAARTDLDGLRKEDYPANIQGVENLIQAIRQTPSIQRCLFTSSQLVCKIGYTPRHPRDYCPSTPYGESKVETENLVHAFDGGGVTWCILRPTTVWGAGMNAHYRSFFSHLHHGRYFHVGNRPLLKSYGYVGNIVYQLAQFLEASQTSLHRKTFYLADYDPICLQDWIDRIQKQNAGHTPITLPISVARSIARLGDVIGSMGAARFFPFNTFRLNNILTEYQIDLRNTHEICGELPFTMDLGIQNLCQWLKKDVFPSK